MNIKVSTTSIQTLVSCTDNPKFHTSLQRLRRQIWPSPRVVSLQSKVKARAVFLFWGALGTGRNHPELIHSQSKIC